MTVVILTQDEELNLPSCIESIQGNVDDIHVLDSGSTDRTLEIARHYGVSVHQRAFTSFADQRNWAIDQIPHRHDWAFHLDADERFTPGLCDEIGARLANEPDEAGFFVPSKLMFGDRWLRYSGEYPAYQLRLFDRRRVRFQDVGHGQREVADGPIGKLTSPYLHFAFSKGLEHWFQKHARYAKLEAAECLNQPTGIGGELHSLVFGSSLERRRAAKRLSYRLPARGTLRLLHMLILKRGILDGRAGIAYARMKAVYESMAGAYIAAAKNGSSVGTERLGQNGVVERTGK